MEASWDIDQTDRNVSIRPILSKTLFAMGQLRELRTLLSSMSRFPERHAKGSVLASTLIPCIFRLGLTVFD